MKNFSLKSFLILLSSATLTLSCKSSQNAQEASSSVKGDLGSWSKTCVAPVTDTTVTVEDAFVVNSTTQIVLDIRVRGKSKRIKSNVIGNVVEGEFNKKPHKVNETKKLYSHQEFVEMKVDNFELNGGHIAKKVSETGKKIEYRVGIRNDTVFIFDPALPALVLPEVAGEKEKIIGSYNSDRKTIDFHDIVKIHFRSVGRSDLAGLPQRYKKENNEISISIENGTREGC